MILFTKISERLTTDQKFVVVAAFIVMGVFVLVEMWRNRP